ncbi:LacI family transcriptional regulator [Lachnospiraceae bacterium OttesenSCG-928-D06]|nr:LacI family transcriptional regulator [Lachnospiraceae bacterium OttesenSCG-928-D06]
MATIKDIANKLGISLSTVSKGLNGASDISEELRQNVLDTAVELGYTTKKMKKEEHKKLCLFIENMEYATPEHFGYEIVLGFKQAAFRANWDIAVVPVTPAFQLEEKYDTYMLKNGYQGGFLVGFALQDEWMRQLNTTSIPTALFDNYIRKNSNVAYVGTDSFEGIDTAIEHLASLGHQKIALLNGSPNSMITELRKQAFLDAMNTHNLTIYDELVAYGYYVAESAQNFVPFFLKEGVTAIVCGNDLLASGVIRECETRGYYVPEDISVIGFDDIPMSAHLIPPLTTIRQERIELGKCGFYALNSLIHKVSISKNLLRPQFIIRSSTAPVSNGKTNRRYEASF